MLLIINLVTFIKANNTIKLKQINQMIIQLLYNYFTVFEVWVLKALMVILSMDYVFQQNVIADEYQ